MLIDDKKLKRILLEENYVTESDMQTAEEYARARNTSIRDYLLSEGVMDKILIGQAIAEYFKVPYADLSKIRVEEDTLHLIPELVARKNGVVSFSLNQGILKVGMTDPTDLEIVHQLEKRVGTEVQPHYITEQDWEDAMSAYKSTLRDQFVNIFIELKKPELSKDARDEMTIKMVNTLMQYGYENKSSDIHVEPYEDKLLIRFRIDGVMHDVLDIPKDFSELIMSRIKILSKMRTDEHRTAQDGKFRYKTGDETIDVRVSVLPVTHGEKTVMRLLSAKSRQFSLADLGLADHDLNKLKRAIKHPHGMILVTGPTGSGKTTTLYAVLKILNKRDVNIATIEDPVEYDIEGISQIQVNPKTNLTFASGLRSIVRQDPDIIMIGEIRDEETAGIAINSALTGHLVLSTLHTNDAATSLPRLLDMGIEPFLVASTVNVIVAQRLVRKLCSNCRVSYTVSEEDQRLLLTETHIKEILEKKGYGDFDKLRLYKGGGCKVCGNSGYKGRIGVFEVLEMEENIRELVLHQASSDELTKQARENGMTTMMEDGVDMVLNGVTTIEEVLRVTRE
ncbi:GspE/PulE family protein [Patescibacteria group bacterium]|nr:GspE/PulE family protein [Patescibacteria group bacterium]